MAPYGSMASDFSGPWLSRGLPMQTLASVGSGWEGLFLFGSWKGAFGFGDVEMWTRPPQPVSETQHQSDSQTKVSGLVAEVQG